MGRWENVPSSLGTLRVYIINDDTTGSYVFGDQITEHVRVHAILIIRSGSVGRQTSSRPPNGGWNVLRVFTGKNPFCTNPVWRSGPGPDPVTVPVPGTIFVEEYPNKLPRFYLPVD